MAYSGERYPSPAFLNCPHASATAILIFHNNRKFLRKTRSRLNLYMPFKKAVSIQTELK
jgi:hypothetical protein